MRYDPAVENDRARFETLLETLDSSAYECDADGADDDAVIFIFELESGAFVSFLTNGVEREVWAERPDDDCEEGADPSSSLYGEDVWDASKLKTLLLWAEGEDLEDE